MSAALGTGRLIGLDLGSRRIGVAVTDNDRTVATGVSNIERSGDRVSDHAAVARTVAEHGAVGVVVGLPLSLSGASGPAARAVLDEVDALRGVLDVPVDTVDERFSSVVAGDALRGTVRSGRKRRQLVDRTAAAGILQTWIDRERVSR